MKRVLAAVAAVVIVSAAPAFAATKKPVTTAPSHEKMITLKQADKNSDGYISRSEADASPALSKQFGTLDANSDGKLSAQEYAKHK